MKKYRGVKENPNTLIRSGIRKNLKMDDIARVEAEASLFFSLVTSWPSESIDFLAVCIFFFDFFYTLKFGIVGMVLLPYRPYVSKVSYYSFLQICMS